MARRFHLRAQRFHIALVSFRIRHGPLRPRRIVLVHQRARHPIDDLHHIALVRRLLPLDNFLAVQNDPGIVARFDRRFHQSLLDHPALFRFRILFQVQFESADAVDGARPGLAYSLFQFELFFRISGRIERHGSRLRAAGRGQHHGQDKNNCDWRFHFGTARIHSARLAARSRAICRKLSFFATRSSIGRNCSGATSLFP